MATADAVATGLHVDLFLLCGQTPGVSAAAALTSAVAYTKAAEAAGFDGVWLAEHHFIRYGSCPSAVALAAHLLGATSRIRVGTAAAILTNRHPVALAEEALLLDIVSGGRFALGTGRGGPWVDLEVFGTGMDRYEHGFAEAVDLLLAALHNPGPVTGTGPRFTFRPVAVVPPPARRVPVWIAATSNATAMLAADRRLPLLLGVHDDDAGKSAMLSAYAHRHPEPVEHVSAHLATVGDPETYRQTLTAWLHHTRDYQRLAEGPPASRDVAAYTEHLLRLHPPSTADELARRLHETADITGVNRLMLIVEAAGPPDEVLDLIGTLGATVVPDLHQARRTTRQTHGGLV